MNYELGYMTVLSRLGLDKLAGIDESTSLYLKIAQLSEDQLEKVAAEMGMTKEALLERIVPWLAKFFGRRGVAQGAEAAASKVAPAAERVVARAPIRPPEPAYRVAPEPSDTASVQDILASRRAKARKVKPPAWKAPPPSPAQRAAAAPKQRIPRPGDVLGEDIRSGRVVPVPRPTPKAPGETPGPGMPRGLKWGLGLGGAGLAGYSMFGGDGGQQPQQQYGQGIDPRVWEAYQQQGYMQ